MEELLTAAGLPRGTFVLLPELCDTGFSFNLPAIVERLVREEIERVARGA